jgi:hypothetical protein
MNLDSQLSDRDPGLHFGEIDADATFTGTWTHVNGGPVLRLAKASLQLRLRLMTDWALVRRHRIFVSCPHDRELSWHRFKPRLERRDFRTSHFDEAGGRCRPEAQERTSIVPDAERTLFIVRSPRVSGPRVRGGATGGRGQIAGPICAHGFTCFHHACLDHAVDPYHLELDSSNQSCPASRRLGNRDNR